MSLHLVHIHCFPIAHITITAPLALLFTFIAECVCNRRTRQYLHCQLHCLHHFCLHCFCDSNIYFYYFIYVILKRFIYIEILRVLIIIEYLLKKNLREIFIIVNTLYLILNLNLLLIKTLIMLYIVFRIFKTLDNTLSILEIYLIYLVTE